MPRDPETAAIPTATTPTATTPAATTPALSRTPARETPPLDRELWRIDGATEETLRALGPALAPVLDSALGDFYAFMATQPGVAPLLSDPARTSAIQRAHRDHWTRFFTANFDSEYRERVHAIGQSHQTAGLETRYYMAGYAMLLERMSARIIAAHRFDRARAAEEVGALIRCTLMEAELALSVYHRAASDADMGNEMDEFAETFDRELTEAVDLVRHNAASIDGPK